MDSASMARIEVEDPSAINSLYPLPSRSTRMGSRRCCKFAKEVLGLWGLCELERKGASNSYAANEY